MVLMQARRVAALVTLGDAETFEALVRECTAAARAGDEVRVLFRDESIPAICMDVVRRRLVPDQFADHGERIAASVDASLAALAGAGDVRLYACTSSMYLWGVTAQDLLPSIDGGRGLIAFLADDLAGAARVLTY
jgi:peroxiredoxin family protein